MELLPNFILPRPYIADWDFSGVIVDPNSSNFAVGDEVFGMILPR